MALFLSSTPARARRFRMMSTRQVVKACIEEAKGRAFVIAGAGSKLDGGSDRFCEVRGEAGPMACLSSRPTTYNKPTQEGLYQHFKAINDVVGVPIIIYKTSRDVR